MLLKNRIYLVLAILLLLAFLLSRNLRLGRQSNGPAFDRNNPELVFTKHARCRMDCRHIDESEIREILHSGRINYAKSEPDARPDPKFALEGLTHDGQEVRIILAPSGRKTVVITVIDLDREWQCDCK